MNRRERRAMERVTQKEFDKIKSQTLKQLKQRYPDKNFTKEEIDAADEKIIDIINEVKSFQTNV
jgi:hypothetical protein